MEERYDYDLDPVTFITVGTVGPPGRRTFYLQAARERTVVSLAIEKEQAVALAASVDRLLVNLFRDQPEWSLEPVAANLDLLQPLDEAFRIAEMGIGIDEERSAFVLVAREVPTDEEEAEIEGRTARFVASFEQMMALAKRALEVAGQGRPLCPLCGRPIDPEGHTCPRRNGHGTLPR